MMSKEKMMNEGKLMSEERIRDALRMEAEVPEGANERIMRAARRSGCRSARIYKMAPAVAACAAVVLLSGVAVNAATGGGIVRFLTGSENSVLYIPDDSEMEATESSWTDPEGVEHKQLDVRMGNHIFSTSAEKDASSVELVVPVEGLKNGMQFMTFRAYALPWADTEMDIYFTIRKEFASDFEYNFAGVGQDKKAEMTAEVCAKMRDMIRDEERECVRKGVLDAVNAFESGRKVATMNYTAFRKMEDWEEDLGERQFTDESGERWTRDRESNDWVCEDVTDITDSHYYLLVDSAYGTGRTYVMEINEGNWSLGRYSGEKMETVDESGIPVYDRRR